MALTSAGMTWSGAAQTHPDALRLFETAPNLIFLPVFMAPAGKKAGLISVGDSMGGRLWMGLGVRQGDLIYDIAGFKFHPDFPEAGPLLNKLRSASDFEVLLERDGKPLRITYRFVV